MPRFRCNVCEPPPGGFVYEADDVLAPCPRCGRSEDPSVAPLTDVHLVVWDPQGNVRGQDGSRWRIVCLPDREILAEQRARGDPDTFAASDSPLATTCPRCRASKEWLERAAKNTHLRREAAREKIRAAQRPTSVLIDPGRGEEV